MSLNSTPASGRVHIGIYGRRNAGKSQPDQRVDPGRSSPSYPTWLGRRRIPYPRQWNASAGSGGADRHRWLGRRRGTGRAARTQEHARTGPRRYRLLVLDGNAGGNAAERALLDACAARGVTCLLVRNKSDQYPQHADGDGAFWVSANRRKYQRAAGADRVAGAGRAAAAADYRRPARARRPCRTRYAHRRVRAERPADSPQQPDYPRHTRRGRPGPRHERRRAGAGVFTPA